MSKARELSVVPNQSPAFKNRIINPGMVIDQRNAGASVTITGSTSLYSVDRWQGAAGSSAGVYTLQQVSDAPIGFINSLKATVTTAEAFVTYNYTLVQRVEGFNTADLGWGTANASSVTLSFWVKSSLTGSFGGSLCNNAFDRAYPFPYTINAANTWEYKTVTIPGDVAGTWLTNNLTGIQLNISLGASAARSATASAWTTTAARQPTGAVNLISTSGATFYITGVQLEKGSNATSFDYRPYGTELSLCQRYFQRTNGYNISAVSAGAASGSYTYIVEMRTSPTLSASATISVSDGTADYTQSSANVSIGGGTRVTNRAVSITHSNFSGFTQFRVYGLLPNVSGETLFSAEL